MSRKALISRSIEVVVPFHDLDPKDVVWHGYYVKYFEIARCALLAGIDYDYPQMKASGFAWPVIELMVRYARPARFGQRLSVRADLVEWEHRLRILYRVSDAQTGARLTRAHTVQVAVDARSGEMCYRSPNILFHRLGVPLP
jgi:acyl-CoA thioester hydrolase